MSMYVHHAYTCIYLQFYIVSVGNLVTCLFGFHTCIYVYILYMLGFLYTDPKDGIMFSSRCLDLLLLLL